MLGSWLLADLLWTQDLRVCERCGDLVLRPALGFHAVLAHLNTEDDPDGEQTRWL